MGFSSANQETELQKLLVHLKLEENCVFEFFQESTNRLLQLIDTNQLDFAVTPSYNFKNLTQGNIGQICLQSGELLVGISKLSPLADMKSLSTSHIKHQTVYYYSPFESNFMQDLLLDQLPHVFNESEIHRCPSLELRDICVASNRGIGFYPSPFMSLEKLRNPMIKFLPLADVNNLSYTSSFFYNVTCSNQKILSIIKQVESFSQIHTNI